MMSSEIDLAGLTVMVTGASSGIGAATAWALHRVGALPVLAARREDRLRELSAELDGALAVPVDVTDGAAVAHLVEATLGRHGRIDGLVNNAGASGVTGPLLDTDLDDFGTILALNVVGLLRMIQAVTPPMRDAGGGRIVNVSSGTTRRTATGTGAYASTKIAVNMLSAVAREELAGDGIVVSTLLPSITESEFGGGLFTAGVEARPGFVGHTAEYVAGFVLRMLRTGEDVVDVPHGPERPELIAD